MAGLGRATSLVLLAAFVAATAAGCGGPQWPGPGGSSGTPSPAVPSRVTTIAPDSGPLGPAAPAGGAAAGAAGGGVATVASAATASSPVPAAAGSCERARFADHAGLGTGAFERYLWQPYQQGRFASGAPGREQAVAEAALAAGLALREVAAALHDIESCPDLQVLATTIRTGLASVAAAATGLGAGAVDGDALSVLADRVAAIHRQAAAAGLVVPDRFPSLTDLLPATGR